jgi:hypothetical protein
LSPDRGPERGNALAQEHPTVSLKAKHRDRLFTFWLQVVYLVALGVLAGLYVHGTIDARHFIGSVPTPVLWFGALGAVLISLTGVFQWCDEKWNLCYRYWHWSRPLIGASLGLVSVLIVQAGILAAGSDPTGNQPNVPKYLTYYLVAFLVGYREETFRELIKRLADVLLTPEGAAKAGPPTLSLLHPDSGPRTASTSVIILGTGLTGANEVKFGATQAQFNVDSDGQITAIAPTSDVVGPVAVAVTTPAGSAAGLQFTYT